MQHFRGSVIILCTKVKARDIFQQQCRSSSSSSRSTKVLHRPIQGTGHTPILIVPILWRPWRREKLLANFWKMGARPSLQYIQFFYYLGNYVDNTALAPSASAATLESRNTYYTSCTSHVHIVLKNRPSLTYQIHYWRPLIKNIRIFQQHRKMRHLLLLSRSYIIP